MPGSVAEIYPEKSQTLNAISLKSAVLCADCDVVSDSPHDYCLVCGSRSLLNMSRLLGGMMPTERAKVVEMPAASLLRPVLLFPRSHRAGIRRHRVRFKRGLR